MSTYIQRCSMDGGKYLVLIWSIISFISLDVEDQFKSIGKSKDWFMKEDDENFGANYIYGLIAILSESGGANHFDGIDDDEKLKFNSILSELLLNRTSRYWRKSELTLNKRWLDIRLMAKKILMANNLWVNLPNHSFWIPDHTEIWWDSYKEIA